MDFSFQWYSPLQAKIHLQDRALITSEVLTQHLAVDIAPTSPAASKDMIKLLAISLMVPSTSLSGPLSPMQTSLAAPAMAGQSN